MTTPHVNWLIGLFLASTILQNATARFPFYSKKPLVHKPQHYIGEKLILTEYINANKIQEAREASEVHHDAFQNIVSYSGYLTVDSENNGSLFFWYFPSANDPSSNSVQVWLQGGPGASSLYGLFAEHGPFDVKDNGSVILRDKSWHKIHSMIYIDQPVGTGFSYTDGDLVTDQTKVGEHLYSALIQFLTIFPELQQNRFFISGESYAGKYVPAIGYAIHQHNPMANLKINLEGLIIGNGLSDPVHQFKYGDLCYQLGLLDRQGLEQFTIYEKNIVAEIEQGNYASATEVWNMMLTDVFRGYTGLENIYNFIKDTEDDPTAWESFIVRDDIRQALHVGNANYESESYDVYYGLYADITKSVVPWIVELLNHYRVLIFNGQLDIIVGYVLTENYLQNLNFSATEEYKKAGRNCIYEDGRLAGYVKLAGNLTEVMVRDAGHMAPADQPEVLFSLISNFVKGNPIA